VNTCARRRILSLQFGNVQALKPRRCEALTECSLTDWCQSACRSLSWTRLSCCFATAGGFPTDYCPHNLAHLNAAHPAFNVGTCFRGPLLTATNMSENVQGPHSRINAASERRFLCHTFASHLVASFPPITRVYSQTGQATISRSMPW
jgi:hypothetical protein